MHTRSADTSRRPRRSRAAGSFVFVSVAAAALTAGLVSCSRERSSSKSASDTAPPSVESLAMPAPPPAPVRPDVSNEAPFAGRGAAGGTSGGAMPASEFSVLSSQAIAVAAHSATGVSASRSAQQPAGSVLAPAMIIRTGQVVVEVDSIDRAVVLVRQVATRLGGYVANTSLTGGDNQVRGATLELKLPAARFEEALAGLRPIGKVETENVTAEDVGEEFVDVTARVANARRLEERLIGLLARRTGKLEDVLKVERELARVREEIERYEGRLRYLRTRSAVSTLAVTVHEPRPVLATNEPGVNPIADAFRAAWRNFVGLTAAMIASMGVVIPLGVVFALAWAAWRRFGRPIRVGGAGGEAAG